MQKRKLRLKDINNLLKVTPQGAPPCGTPVLSAKRGCFSLSVRRRLSPELVLVEGAGGRLALGDSSGRRCESLEPRGGAQALAGVEEEHRDQVGVRAGKNEGPAQIPTSQSRQYGTGPHLEGHQRTEVRARR